MIQGQSSPLLNRGKLKGKRGIMLPGEKKVTEIKGRPYYTAVGQGSSALCLIP
jgi:hypothetical protein